MLNDLKWIMKMLRSNNVCDEDGCPLTFWEKLGVAWEVILGTIVFEHTTKQQRDE